MSSLMTVKLRRDLRATWPRLALMVVAIAVSLTAFAGVLFAWSASGRETSDAYASTEPASATILLDEAIDIDEMTTIIAQARARPGIIEATGRTQFTSEVEVNGEPRTIPLQVFVAAPEDPMRVARVFIRQRSWPPAPDELYLGGDSLSLLDVAVGDLVTVTIPDGRRVDLRVADTVYDPSLSPSPQEQTGRGYLSAASLGTTGRPARFDQLKIQVAGPEPTTPSRDRDVIVAAASDVAQWLQRDHGVVIREVQVPTPYAHPHKWQADALLGALLAGAAAALLLATILVATMLNNLFTQQIPQIGIMKAIGARSSRIALLYLAMTLLVSSAATLLALGPAIVVSRVAVTTFLGFLGIQPTSLAPAWWTYLAMLAIGLGLPPLMALFPLVKVSRTTVRAAIDHHGGSAKPSAATGLVARLSRLRRIDRGLLLALRNTLRRPARFLLSAGLLATAGTVFVAGMSLSLGTQAIADEQKAERSWDVDVQLASPTPVGQITSALRGLPGVTRTEALNVSLTSVSGPGQIPLTRTYPDQGHGRVAITALSADATMFAPPPLREGRWLDPHETGAIVINQLTERHLPGLRTGDTVQLLIGGRPTTWRVVGIAEERQGGGGAVYTTAEGLAAATGQPQHVNQLRIATGNHDEPARQAVAEAVNDALTRAGIDVRSAASVSRSEAISAGHLGPVILILLGVALPLGVVGVVGLASTMSANVLDRTREFGIMHAIGARPKAVRRIVVAEGVLLALTSCVVAVIPTLVLTALLGAGLGDLFFAAPLPYRISVPAVGIWLTLAVLGAVLATEAAANRAARLTVREALAHL